MILLSASRTGTTALQTLWFVLQLTDLSDVLRQFLRQFLLLLLPPKSLDSVTHLAPRVLLPSLSPLDILLQRMDCLRRRCSDVMGLRDLLDRLCLIRIPVPISHS